MRAGYASQDLYLAAIAAAERAGRVVVAIDTPEHDGTPWYDTEERPCIGKF